MTLLFNKNFQSINEFYDYLESDTKIVKDHAVPVYISMMLDKIEDLVTREKLLSEIYFDKFDLEIDSTIDLEGKAIDYLKERIKTVTNPILKAKYNHMVWLSNKNTVFAKNAIKYYFEYLRDSNFNKEDNLSNQSFARSVRLLFNLSQTIKYKKEEVIDYILNLLDKSKINGYQECMLLSEIVVNGKNIKIDTLRLIFDHTNKIIESGCYLDFLEDYLKMQILLSQKISESVVTYREKLGDHYLDKALENGGFIVHLFLINAMEQYIKAGNKSKTEEVSILLHKAKADLKFNKVNMDDEGLNGIINDYLKSQKEKIFEFINYSTAEEIFKLIVFSDSIFPSADQFNKEVTPTAFDFVSVIVFDGNKNVSSKSGALRAYDFDINNFSSYFLIWIFMEGVKSGKLSFLAISDYIVDHTWLGDEIVEIGSSGLPETFNWFELIASSLKHFFNQMMIDVELQKIGTIEYQLAIDSLALKFEGLLRTFSIRIGAQTIEYKENETKERISIEKLLDNEKFVTFVPKDDITLFRYLFTSEGKNVRNDVAHSFYRPNDYNVCTMLFLIAAILKLGTNRSSQLQRQEEQNIR